MQTILLNGGNEKMLIEVKNLSKHFYVHHMKQEIIGCENISFAVAEGQFIAITGRSGSGKSTILRCIYRTNLPQKGSIVYHSKKLGTVDLVAAKERTIVELRKSEIAYVSQFLQILPRTTALQMIIGAAMEAGYNEEASQAKAAEILQHFEIKKELWQLYPHTFSGGEKLRLNIAKAMIKSPRLLLLDEPTASLDHASKLKVHSLIKQLKEMKTTMIGIFHDLEFMENICDIEYNMQEGSFMSQ